jgi:hypothetical protein
MVCLWLESVQIHQRCRRLTKIKCLAGLVAYERKVFSILRSVWGKGIRKAYWYG